MLGVFDWVRHIRHQVDIPITICTNISWWLRKLHFKNLKDNFYVFFLAAFVSPEYCLVVSVFSEVYIVYFYSTLKKIILGFTVVVTSCKEKFWSSADKVQKYGLNLAQVVWIQSNMHPYKLKIFHLSTKNVWKPQRFWLRLDFPEATDKQKVHDYCSTFGAAGTGRISKNCRSLIINV